MDRLNLVKNHLSSKSTEVLTLHDSEDPKKLLAKYRSKSTITHREVLNVLWGRHVDLRKEILDIMANDPIYKQYTVNENNRKELRALSLQWIKNFFAKFDKLTYEEYKKDPSTLFILINGLYEFDAALSVKVGVHTSLYGKTILNLGTEKHRDFVDRAFGFVDVGCFGLTELGHGSNARGVLTRADFDPKTREFVINTPVDIGMKFWIGAAANLANMSVIMAQLFIGDKNYGVHGFIVPIRNRQDHTLLPGVLVGDCGLKVGLNAIDNGFLMFKNVRVPYDNLLDKFSQITSEGKFKSPIKSADKRFGISLGSLSGGRLQLIDATNSALRNALTVAIRFAACRRQFGPPGKVEQNILEYPLVQYRLMPYLAETFASTTANYALYENWNNNQDKIFAENNPMLNEIHALSSAFKGIASWSSQRGIQECREMCGGLGYSAYNRIGQLREDNDINATWEGDNNVLLQQTSKFLMDNLRNLKGGNALPYASLQFLKEDLDLNEYAVGADGKSAWAKANFCVEKAFEARTNWLIHISFEQLGKNMMSNEDAWTAWNSSHVFYLRDAAIAYGDTYILSEFARGMSRCKDEKTRDVLKKLHELHGLNRIMNNYGNFLEIGYLTKEDVAYARDRIKTLCTELKDEAIGLIDAVAVPDQLLNSAIGASDGDIYNRFITAVWTAPGCFERPPYWKEIRNEKKN